MNSTHAFISPVGLRRALFARKTPTTSKRPSTKCSRTSGNEALSRRSFAKLFAISLATSAIAESTNVQRAVAARPEGVNRPDLLPKEYTSVIDLERFLASGEVKRLRDKIADLEQRTGFKIRVLTQRFPQTPGLAIRDYWQVDDNSVIMVADYFGGTGQLLKFNVGRNVDTLLPPRFWSILSSSLGNKFYVQKNGEAAAIINSVDSIRTCLLNDGCNAPPNFDSAF